MSAPGAMEAVEAVEAVKAVESVESVESHCLGPRMSDRPVSPDRVNNHIK